MYVFKGALHAITLNQEAHASLKVVEQLLEGFALLLQIAHAVAGIVRSIYGCFLAGYVEIHGHLASLWTI